jgi:hypothetical protein
MSGSKDGLCPHCNGTMIAKREFEFGVNDDGTIDPSCPLAETNIFCIECGVDATGDQYVSLSRSLHKAIKIHVA